MLAPFEDKGSVLIINNIMRCRKMHYIRFAYINNQPICNKPKCNHIDNRLGKMIVIINTFIT